MKKLRQRLLAATIVFVLAYLMSDQNLVNTIMFNKSSIIINCFFFLSFLFFGFLFTPIVPEIPKWLANIGMHGIPERLVRGVYVVACTVFLFVSNMIIEVMKESTPVTSLPVSGYVCLVASSAMLAIIGVLITDKFNISTMRHGKELSRLRDVKPQQSTTPELHAQSIH